MSEELYVDGLGLAPGVMETIVAIADRTGYADQFYFSKLFKRTFGLSPNAYRKKMKM